jgi:transglutaminase-like putative cysteine protease
MTQTYDIRHRTRFSYERPVAFARSNVRLQPIAWPDQQLLNYNLRVEPGGALVTRPARAGLVNLTRVVVADSTNWLDVISEARVSVTRPVAGAQPGDPNVAEIARLSRETADVGDMSPANFLYPSPNIPANAAILEWAAESLAPDRGIVDAAYNLAWRMWTEFRFDTAITTAETPPAQAFAARAGVCQDFAQIMICGLRAVGLPAAYASGYIRTIPPDGEARLQGADAMHGWVLAWCGPARGWMGFDPTNGIVMAEDHVLVAVGRDYRDIAPIDGVFTGSGAQDVRVEVDMAPVLEPV